MRAAHHLEVDVFNEEHGVPELDVAGRHVVAHRLQHVARVGRRCDVGGPGRAGEDDAEVLLGAADARRVLQLQAVLAVRDEWLRRTGATREAAAGRRTVAASCCR